MKLLGALSVPREKLVEFQSDALKELLRGVLTVTRLNQLERVRKGFTAYLQSLGLHPTDESVLNWLQENPGDTIAAFVFQTDEGKIDFLIKAGTNAELRQIGIKNVEESNNVEGTSRVRQVHVGERKGSKKSGVVQEGQQRRPSLYD